MQRLSSENNLIQPKKWEVKQMIKERITLSGDNRAKRINQIMEYAGWYEGRKADISISEQYYTEHGNEMMKTTKQFFYSFFGICCEWYFEKSDINRAADFEFGLFPYLINNIKNNLRHTYFLDMSGFELEEIERAAGEPCQPVGHIGYYYPAEIWISESGKLYAQYEYRDDVVCFTDIFALLEHELEKFPLDSVAMKTVEALDKSTS